MKEFKERRRGIVKRLPVSSDNVSGKKKRIFQEDPLKSVSRKKKLVSVQIKKKAKITSNLFAAYGSDSDTDSDSG